MRRVFGCSNEYTYFGNCSKFCFLFCCLHGSLELKFFFFLSQDVLKDANELEPLIQEVSSSAEALMAHCNPDDCDVIQRKLDLLSDNCNSLSDKSQHRVSVLKETADLCESFNKEHDDLSAWFQSIEKQLNDVKSGGEEVEKIKV